MKIFLAGMLVMLSGCFSSANGKVPSNGEPEQFTIDIRTEDDIDRFLATLTPGQQMELMIYADAMGAWDATGRSGPEPQPPQWLKPYLQAKPHLLSGVSGKRSRNPTAAAYYSPKETGEWEPQNLIKVYSAPYGMNCPPCERLKVWLNSLTKEQREGLSVEFVFIDQQAHPKWIQSYPTLHWKVDDQWWKSEGWEGIDKFAITYNQTLKLSKKKGGTTRLPAPLPESNLPNSSLDQKQPSPDGTTASELSQSDTEYASSFRQKRRWR